MWKYEMRLFSSLCARRLRSSIVSAVITRVVSSAYGLTFEFGTVLMMLFIYNKKKVVDSVLPCGIPCVMMAGSDCACVVCVVCFRFVKYDLKKRVAPSVKLNSCLSLCKSLLCDIVS